MDNAQGKKIYYGIVLDNAQLRQDADQSKNIFREIGDASKTEASRIDNAFRKIAGAAAAVFTVQQAANFAGSIVRVRGEVEALSISFETLLGGNKQKAHALFSEIRTFAVNTPMMLNDLARGAQMLLSFNIEAERVMPILKQIGDISMGDAQKFNSLTLAFSQMMSTGKLMGQDLLQMINAGFNPLSVISEKTGKSIGQLKKDMEAGAISSEMVADAFAAATAEGGKFYGMLEKQSKGINGSISNLKGAIEDMMNDIGTANQDIITGSISAATSVVRHYKEIGETIAVLVATYGTYRAALIATEAVRKSVETVQHTEEAAELYKLLTAEQQAQISKKGLAKTSAEYYAMVKAETAANVQAAQSALTKARADVTASNQAVAARRAEYIAAKQLEAQRLTELTAISATGTAKQTEAAQRKLAAAETQRESAAIAFQSATRDFNTKKTAVETAARTANTTATAVNTAAQTANATATGFLTVAKTRLAVVATRLNAVIMANPYALAAAAVIALGYGLYKLVTYQTDAEKAQSKLNDAIKASGKEIDSEVHQIDAMFGRLKAARQGTDEYRAAKEAIMNRYGEYLKKLGDEKTALNDIAAAYTLITEEAKKAARARAMETFTKEAADTLAEKEGDVKDEVKKLLDKKYKGQKGADGVSLSETYYWKIKPVIEGEAEITDEIRDIIGGFERTKMVQTGIIPGSDAPVYSEITVNDLQAQMDAAANARAIFSRSMEQARMKFGENPTAGDEGQTAFDVATASLQQFMDRLPKVSEELAALKNAEKPDAAAIAAKEQEIEQIKAKTLARERELSVIKDVKAQIETLQKEQLNYGKDDEEYKSLEARIKYLKTKLPETDGQQSKAENEAARIKRETAERIRKIQEYEESVKKQVAQSELDITQAKIDAQEEGFEKEMAQIDLTYKRLNFTNLQREAEMVEALRDARALQWENENPTAKAKGETFDRSTVTATNLSPEEKAQIEAYTEVATDFKKKAEADLLKKLLDQYRTYEQQRTEIARKFDADRAAIEKSDASQSDKEAALSVLEKRRKEAIKAVNEEEIASMQKSSDVLVRLFEDASDKSVSEILKITETAEQLMSYLANTKSADITPKFGFTAAQLRTLKDSPKDLEAISDGIKKLNSEAVQKNPFATLAKNLKDLFAAGASDDKTEKKLAKLGESAAASADMIGGLAGSLSDMFSAMGNNELAGAMDTVQGIMSAVSNIGEGFAKGGIVGGVFAAVGELAKGIGKIFLAEARHREALKAIQKDQIAQQREYNLLLLEQNLLYEKGSTIFGTDEYGKAMNAIEVYKQALADLNEALAGNDAQKGKVQRGNHFLAMFGIKDAQAALKQIYAGLADIEIVTGHKKTGLFGWGKGKDLYSSVLSVYPDLIKSNGEFNKELAQTIISTRKMSDEDKNALQNMIDLYEKYEEAMQSVRDYLSGIFGELGNTMSDALVDAFKNGSDAAEAFSKSVSDMLENLAQQMIYSVTLAPIMEKAQEQMLEIMKNGDLTDAEKFSQYAGVLSNLTDQALAQQENANYLMKLYQDMAAEKGIDIFQPDGEREASQKSGITASQESVNEGNGRLTAIQGHTFDIREAVNAIAASKTQDLMKIEINTERLHTIDANVFGIREASNLLVANSARMLQHLAGIEDNTSNLHAMRDDLSSIRNDMRAELSSVRHTVSDIALKGLKLKH